MKQSVSLVALRCPHCDTPITAGSSEYAWKCGQCGQGILLNKEKTLKEIMISYQQPAHEDSPGCPYWVLEVSVQFQGAHLPANRKEELTQFWQNLHKFFIPAFEMGPVERIQRSTALLRTPPIPISVESYQFRPVVLSPRDLPVYVEAVVLQMEAERQDDLKHLIFDLQLSEADLWVLPD
ncbi:MAG: hypothetical protein BGO78_12420 [Chloroflexi bacterium 44-23]|nr:MAG: hypothetical protein BGO78_12420 [Chloroflexi bacterium 44-23]